MTREDFDTETLEEQKARQAKMGRLLDENRNEEAQDARPIDLPSSMPENEKAFLLTAMKNAMVKKFENNAIWRQNYDLLWEEIYGLYQSTLSSRKVKTRTKIFIPVIFQVIEAAVPKFINTLFTTDDFFDVKPVGTVSTTFQARSIKELIQYQLRMANFFVKFMDYAKQLLLYGTSYLKVFWVVKRKWVWTRTPVREDVTILGFKVGNKIVRWDTIKEYRVVERRPEVEVVDILDVYPDANAEHEQEEDKGFFIRSWISLEQFKRMGAGKYPVYANTDAALLSKDATENKAMSRSQRITRRGLRTQVRDTEKMVELLSYWGPYDVDQDGIEEEAHIIIANRSVIVKAQGNPFHHQKRPLIRGVLFPVVKEWMGIGLVEPVITLQHELNTLRRMRLDNINVLINRMWLVDGGADIDLDSLITVPNGIITLDGQDSVSVLDAKDVTQSAYLEAQNVQTDIENTTSPKSIQGTPQSGKLGRTARGAQLIIGQALEKFGTAIRLTEEMVLEPMLNMVHQLNGQFIDDDETLFDPDLYGHAFSKRVPTPEDIRAMTRFETKSLSEMIGAESKINQIINFRGVFGDVLSPETNTFLAKRVWKLMGNKEEELDNITAVPPTPGTGNQLSQSIGAQVGNQGATSQATPPTPPAPTGGR